MSLEMAHKVIVPQKKNYVPQFLKQRDINSYSLQKGPVSDSKIMSPEPEETRVQKRHIRIGMTA
jgi:hypothetical protein